MLGADRPAQRPSASDVVTLRDAAPADAAALAAVFADAIRTAGPRHYTPEQVAAWSAVGADPAAFARRLLTGRTWVAEEGGAAVGFAVLCDDGRVGALYIRGDRQGRGIGRRLLEAVLGAARARGEARLYAEASAFSLPLFERVGFAVVGTERVERDGVWFERHLVERVLEGPAAR